MYTRVYTLGVNSLKDIIVQSNQVAYNTNNYTMKNIWRKIQENKNSNNSFFYCLSTFKVVANMKQTKTSYHW